MDTVRDFFASAPTVLADHLFLVLSLLGLVIVGILIYRWRAEIQYLLFKWWIGLPVIGSIARYARQDQKHVSGHGTDDGGDPWYLSERNLCAGYYRFYDLANKDADFFDKRADYLNKIEDRGRKSIGWFGLCGLGLVLVAPESFLFTLVMVPFMVSTLSTDQAELTAIVVAVFIAVILVIATHYCGARIYKNSLIIKARKWYQHAKSKQAAKRLQPSHREIDIDSTKLDDKEPNYLHIINRMKVNAEVKPKLWPPRIIFAVIIAFAFAMFYLRAWSLKTLETDQANTSPYASLSAQTGDDWPFSTLRAGETSQDNPQADQRTAKEISAARIAAYNMSFAIMSAVFVCVQLICVGIGYAYTFAGTHSKDAARNIAGFSSKSEFSAWYERKREQIARDADEHLNQLQEAIAGQDELGGSDEEENHRYRSFMHYVHEREEEREKERMRRSQQTARAEHGTAAAGAEPPSPGMEPSVPAHTASVDDRTQETDRETMQTVHGAPARTRQGA